jgi:KaiC/GvpD/RAD55 family RecA-like ATPase
MAKKKAGTDVPSNAPRKPTAKKKFSLDDFKKKTGAEKIASKPLEWIPIDDALTEATGMPGIPKGYVTLFRGYSNTGKSTALMRGIVNAQKNGDLPVIIDTENNIDEGNERLSNMGFDWDGDYILIKNSNLLTQFGKVQNKERREASIEDMAKYVYYIIDQQDAGNLPYDLFIGIDSIGTLNCIKTIDAAVKDSNDNNMWNAGAYEKSFMSILNNTIPSSRKVTSPYTNTIAAVQKIWYDSMNKVVKHKGGETFWFGGRLIYNFGGIITHGTKRLTAASKSRDVNYGFENKVNIAKNHVDGALGGISLEGKIGSTPHGFIYTDEDGIKAYKKKNILHFRNILGDQTLTADDITITANDMDAEGNVIVKSKVSIGSDDVTTDTKE